MNEVAVRGQEVGRQEVEKPTQPPTEPVSSEKVPEQKKKRKIHFNLKTVRVKRKLIQEPKPTPAEFMTPRQLYQARGYEQFGMRSAAEQNVSLQTQTERQIIRDEKLVEQELEKEYKLEEPHHKTKVSFGEKVKNIAEDFQWTVGKLTRGNIVKHLRQIAHDPAHYQEELEAELQRSLNTMTEPSEDRVFSTLTKLQAGTTAVASVLPPIPLGVVFVGPIPIPVVYSSGTILVESVNNIPNTVKAFKEKRFRKGFAYATMTTIGALTGFIPMSHHFTNTLYTEILQKPFDHAETHGMLQIVDSLFANTATAQQHALGKQLVDKATKQYAATHGSAVPLQERLRDIQSFEQQKKDVLLQKRAQLELDLLALPERKKISQKIALITKPTEIKKRIAITGEHFRLGQELIDVEHRLHTIPQLLEIIRASTVEAKQTTLGA
ncbi:MAG TPA: hypothetical protein VLB73_01795 [Patescibacteria group bacterium]|nr:hypothetical protein [Patescibacteria group bacterium]